jgi:hypothetical protein
MAQKKIGMIAGAEGNAIIKVKSKKQKVKKYRIQVTKATRYKGIHILAD